MIRKKCVPVSGKIVQKIEGRALPDDGKDG